MKFEKVTNGLVIVTPDGLESIESIEIGRLAGVLNIPEVYLMNASRGKLTSKQGSSYPTIAIADVQDVLSQIKRLGVPLDITVEKKTLTIQRSQEVTTTLVIREKN